MANLKQWWHTIKRHNKKKIKLEGREHLVSGFRETDRPRTRPSAFLEDKYINILAWLLAIIEILAYSHALDFSCFKEENSYILRG